LILDEPTNHLDRESVGRVIANIQALPTKPAILLISHRHELLAGVDEVIELVGGRIVDHHRALASPPERDAGREAVGG
jgi:ABC-type transport system involved in cytochrome bd biosynthesis fused ATPase/permease subunit